jgi:hypothetical protein
MRWRTRREISNFVIWHYICVKITSSSGFTMGCRGTERLDGIKFSGENPKVFRLSALKIDHHDGAVGSWRRLA